MRKEYRKFTISDLRRIIKLRETGLSVNEIAELLKSNPQTIINLLDEFSKEGFKRSVDK